MTDILLVAAHASSAKRGEGYTWLCESSDERERWLKALRSVLADGVAQCPNFSPLGRFDGNVAHSTGRHGLKLSDYFPAVGGAGCPDEATGWRERSGWSWADSSFTLERLISDLPLPPAARPRLVPPQGAPAHSG